MTDKFIAYPAIFHPTHNARDLYLVKFPDLPNTFTEGYGLADAYVMASDVLAEMNYNQKDLPEPSNPKIFTLADEDFTAVISANLSAKQRQLRRHVRKNVTIPADLAAWAEAADINLSAALAETLAEKHARMNDKSSPK
jgi:predicted RNase H-like HicB family nuclease